MMFWALKRGCHLALGEALEGPRLRFLHISPLGKEVHSVSLGEVADVLEDRSDAAGAASVAVKYKWGVAEYQKGEYDKVIGLLDSIPFAAAHFYVGLAWFEKSDTSAALSHCLGMASEQFQKALRSEPSSSLNAALFHLSLGEVYSRQLGAGIAANRDATLLSATSELGAASKLSATFPNNDIGPRAKLALATTYSYPDFLIPHLSEAETLLRDVVVTANGDLADEARSRLVFTLGATVLNDKRPARKVCEEVKALHRDLDRSPQATSADRLNSAIGLASCAAALGDLSLFRAAEGELQVDVARQQKAGRRLDEAYARENLGTTRMNYASSAQKDLTRFDILEAAAGEFAEAVLLYREVGSNGQCSALDGEARARFYQAEQATGNARFTALSYGIAVFDAMAAMPACRDYMADLDRWVRSARAELSLGDVRKPH